MSEQLRAPVSTDVELCYQTFGDPADEPLVLVMGLGAPLTWWDEELCTMLAHRGFYVVRFDNRDCGRSSRVGGRVTRATLVRAFAGAPTRAPYSLADMAGDVTGLLDHLGVESAHVAGVSMGGMIVQTLALEHPTRVRSLTSIMSTTGRRTVGWQHPALLPTLLGRGGTSKEDFVRQSERLWRLIGSPAYPQSPEATRSRAEDTFDHGVSAAGTLRQMMAILTQPDREPRLRALRKPALVVHGLADKMVHPSGGRATARGLRGSELLLIDGMGHDLPPALHETLAAAIRRTADRA
ncbi:3-oxoadipate enol-lactonase 2 [Nocardioides dokdonensis FR1436]|uniref:3-oxoadipate enol-lactonase 2 n=2 Tax=Nocardioides TaxID=1839 RepID=A0A1A9GK77_9ACTN|nr:3-oxoadipate enol-lactonase 2 [Nocardioides dokdonensis FR1436]